MVPVTSKVAKFKKIYDQKVKEHKKCDTIVLGKLLGRDCAFLIQNMFPITEKYIKEEYVQRSNNVPVTISKPLANETIAKQKKVLALVKAGIHGLVFTDVIVLEEKLGNGLKAIG